MQGAYGVAAFRSRQQVLKTREILRRQGINSTVVSTPREISAGCGLSVKFDLKDTQAVKNAVGNNRSQNLIGLYRVEPSQNAKSRLSPLSMRT